jgi:rRNA-processing protein FCF1
MKQQDLTVLSLKLPRGYAAKVKKRLRGAKRNVSPQYISQIKQGHRTDDKVMEALLQVAEEHTKTVRAQASEFKKRLEKLAVTEEDAA